MLKERLMLRKKKTQMVGNMLENSIYIDLRKAAEDKSI